MNAVLGMMGDHFQHVERHDASQHQREDEEGVDWGDFGQWVGVVKPEYEHWETCGCRNGDIKPGDVVGKLPRNTIPMTYQNSPSAHLGPQTSFHSLYWLSIIPMIKLARDKTCDFLVQPVPSIKTQSSSPSEGRRLPSLDASGVPLHVVDILQEDFNLRTTLAIGETRTYRLEGEG